MVPAVETRAVPYYVRKVKTPVWRGAAVMFGFLYHDGDIRGGGRVFFFFFFFFFASALFLFLRGWGIGMRRMGYSTFVCICDCLLFLVSLSHFLEYLIP